MKKFSKVLITAAMIGCTLIPTLSASAAIDPDTLRAAPDYDPINIDLPYYDDSYPTYKDYLTYKNKTDKTMGEYNPTFYNVILAISIACLGGAIIMVIATSNHHGVTTNKQGQEVSLKTVRRSVLIGAGVFVLGAAIPVVQYWWAESNTMPGESYTIWIFYWPLIAGVFMFIGFMIQYLTTYLKLKKSGELAHTDNAAEMARAAEIAEKKQKIEKVELDAHTAKVYYSKSNSINETFLTWKDGKITANYEKKGKTIEIVNRPLTDIVELRYDQVNPNIIKLVIKFKDGKPLSFLLSKMVFNPSQSLWLTGGAAGVAIGHAAGKFAVPKSPVEELLATREKLQNLDQVVTKNGGQIKTRKNVAMKQAMIIVGIVFAVMILITIIAIAAE